MPEAIRRCANVLGVGINAINMAQAVEACDELISTNRQGYVCVTGVHGVMEAQLDPQLRSTLKRSFLTVPDGMPMVWVGHLQGFRHMKRVYGPDFMLEFCRHSVTRGFRHFLYGGKPGIATELAENLGRRYPGIQMVGTYTPPFRPLSAEEETQLRLTIRQCKPDIIWVGLSTPKQERFMAQYIEHLDTRVMVGVGAAFDIHTGRIKDSPHWIKASGLQWLHRLFQEPRRLWKRYLVNNPAFIMRIAMQLTGVTRYTL